MGRVVKKCWKIRDRITVTVDTDTTARRVDVDRDGRDDLGRDRI